MGVSGCGKSTIGSGLAEQLGLPFYDADDYHPQSNIQKMASGVPLDDDDRQPWLTLLAENIHTWEEQGGAVLACSALKQSYRDLLGTTTHNVIRFIYLKGDKALLASRLRKRDNHFMPDTLLQSQFDTLEPPKNAITIQLNQSIEQILKAIIQAINL